MEQKNSKVMLFLAGELRNKENLFSLIKSGTYDYFAADAGYLFAQELQVPLKKVLGDFDSVKKPCLDNIFVFPSEKDQTDSELALELAIQDGYREILMIAPFGGRLDHTIANLSLLELAHDKNIDLKLYDGENLAFLLSKGTYQLSNQYRYISFFPWNNRAEVSLFDVKYPLNHYYLTTKHPIGISNEPQGMPCVEIHQGSVLCICIENNQEEL